MNGARMVAHGGQLFGLRVVGVGCIEDGIGRPDTHMTVWSNATLVQENCRKVGRSGI